MTKMKKVVMQIMKIITAGIYLIVAIFAIHLADYPNVSPLPVLICGFMIFIIDTIISHILIKTRQENSPWFDPEHKWKYSFPIDIAILLIVILVYLYQIYWM